MNVAVLQTLAEGPTPLTDLRRAAGSPPQTTMRGHLRTLTETGVIERRRRNDFPGSLDFELTPAGREFWQVGKTLKAWLTTAPDEPLQLGSTAAKSAVKAFVEGWDTKVIRALAARPLSLTELSSLITGISYPSLERRLGAMRVAGLIQRTESPGRGTPYGVTSWLRHGIAPLGAAARWERYRAPSQTRPIAPLDAEAAFLLTVPKLELSPELSGSCRLAVEVQTENGGRLAGVLAIVEEGRVVSCATNLRGHADAYATGSANLWLNAVLEGRATGLEQGGDRELSTALTEALHSTLFRVGERR